MIHASFGFGRYLLGIVWYLTLFGTEGEFKHIDKFDEPVSNEERELAYKIALETVTVD